MVSENVDLRMGSSGLLPIVWTSVDEGVYELLTLFSHVIIYSLIIFCFIFENGKLQNLPH